MWVSRKDYERDTLMLREANQLRAKHFAFKLKLGRALSAILPEHLTPGLTAYGYDFDPIFAAAEAVKRSEQRVSDKEILKVVKQMREEA